MRGIDQGGRPYRRRLTGTKKCPKRLQRQWKPVKETSSLAAMMVSLMWPRVVGVSPAARRSGSGKYSENTGEHLLKFGWPLLG